jgi:hypothetical protein
MLLSATDSNSNEKQNYEFPFQPFKTKWSLYVPNVLTYKSLHSAHTVY